MAKERIESRQPHPPDELWFLGDVDDAVIGEPVQQRVPDQRRLPDLGVGAEDVRQALEHHPWLASKRQSLDHRGRLQREVQGVLTPCPWERKIRFIPCPCRKGTNSFLTVLGGLGDQVVAGLEQLGCRDVLHSPVTSSRRRRISSTSSSGSGSRTQRNG